VIGLGAEHLDKKPYTQTEATIYAALEHGINIIDVFMPGEQIRRDIGKALSGRRDQVIIQGHLCSTDEKEQYDISRDLPTCKRYFENLLKFLQTDYIDIGMFFFIDSDEALADIFDNGIVEYAQDLKKQGVIRAIGASSHNAEVAKKLVGTEILDVLMFSINPAFDMLPPQLDINSIFENWDNSPAKNKGVEPARDQLYRFCQEKGVAITVMKALGGGKLMNPEHSPFGKPLSVAQCIHYSLTRPAVVSALIGCESAAHVEEAANYLNIPENERDFAEIIKDYHNNFSGSCVYCNHCLPCPSEIDIAAVNKYRDIAILDRNGIPPSIVQHYKSLKSHGSDCIACGSCESKCPFNVKIIENMEDAAVLFGI